MNEEREKIAKEAELRYLEEMQQTIEERRREILDVGKMRTTLLQRRVHIGNNKR